ncbi:hypothetical protein JA9_003035 [Meyerozyma sp. JA9]|nr:hypothetical protein JA9_003035 [Meyerozyma sp. JA9]
MSAPELKVTPNTPAHEKQDFVSNGEQSGSNNTVSSEPAPKEEMMLGDGLRKSNDSDTTSFGEQSGRLDPENECTEFCVECSACFGLFDSCCPADEEGCLTTAATFCGNILFGCCKAR